MPAAGVPLSTPPLKMTPLGSVPVSTVVGVGYAPAAVVTVKEPELPTVKVALLALVICGA